MGHASGSTKTVLIGDDTAFVRERFTTALHEAGHRAVPVASLAELIAAIEARPVDLILLDLGLPPARGTSVVRAIRSRDEGRTPIVVFSGTITDAGQVRDLAELGITAYVNEYSAPQKIVAALAPHLFPDNFNRRNSPRVQVALAISYRIGNSIASSVTTNIGKGGLGLRATSPLAQGTLMTVRFKLPGSARELDADARVCWTDRNLGMGLQFERIAPANQTALDDFVDAHFFNRRR